jgi:hypothetical protein
MSICKIWQIKKILKRSVMLVSNMLSANISLFNPDQYFPIQINILRFRSLATLNKKEFIVVGQGTAAYREIIVHHSGDCICILFLADLGHYDRFCHGSYGINRIHIS